MAKRVTAYPLEIRNGRTLISDDPGSELDLLLDYPVKRRTLDVNYGVSMAQYQQLSFNEIERRAPLILVELRNKFLRYIKNTSLTKVNIFKEKKSRYFSVEAYYKINQSVASTVKNIGNE
ncbi:hypothetical protein Molly5_93 [Maribacter phage Molly_5]|uniref:Uncharacterized protein n=2 Tax=Mollyvirus TaxID=2948826 RepID=A0A8E4UY38_9CAUD|nr:hypothetical protein M1M29_gp093 [Maribacter phage Molly_1]YP_010357340.1 hypothetical protein M1M30_gp091 [Maribacter phage Colly_1]QQO97781.1 hypothetical protein Molly2_93 [Maribacter phage Molly_2]QQO97981.1 hypothetical protein Molly3_93 [Maribacter phage Molly_3]QQO98181.1 hypothetical protein Molly4_93 [Maribacter phage Molly_4]QQO98381.1 hypothetical protein Molly5_93 [Maribacter phage Molly_5]QQO97379.1 hypothetical protein Colly1_91 [Maribacter phage Colly_1]